jgi:hypothetical protein
MMLNTKGAAFSEAQASGRINRHESAIMEAFTESTDRWSREELSKLTDIKMSSICGAANSLIKKGRLKVVGTTVSEAGVTVQQLGRA